MKLTPSEYLRKWRSQNPDKMRNHNRRYAIKHASYLREYRRIYRIKNRETLLLKTRKYSEEHREEARQRARKWRLNNPSLRRQQYNNDPRNKIRGIVRHAIRDGKIKKGPCQDCGSKKIVHGHHSDYSKPLQVLWLCPACHVHYHHNLHSRRT